MSCFTFIDIRTPKLCMHSSFFQLGNSGNSAISVKGKGLTNAKIYLEKKILQKLKFNYKVTKYQMSIVQQIEPSYFLLMYYI